MPNHTFWISFLNALLSYIIIKVLLNPREDILKYSREIKKCFKTVPSTWKQSAGLSNLALQDTTVREFSKDFK